MKGFTVFSDRGNQVDWSKISSGLGEAVTDWDKSIKAKRAEDENAFRETNKMLAETESTKSQSLNEFILAGADNGRQKITNWYNDLKAGNINRSEYQRRRMNLTDNWNQLASVTKDLDQRIQQSLERQQVGPEGQLPQASQIELEMQAYFGSMANLVNKKLDIDDEGHVLLATMGPDGKPIELNNIKYMNNPLNINYSRVDVPSMVKAEVDNWGKWSIGRISDQRNNPQFPKMKAQLVETITATPRSASSVLVDYTDDDYTVYFSEQDKQAKFNQLKKLNEQIGGGLTDQQIEDRLIQMKQDPNGDYQPVLTDNQLRTAKDIVAREIEMQVGRDVAPAPMYSGGGGSSSSSGSGEDPNQLIAGYKASLKAFGFDPEKVKANPKDYTTWGSGNVDFGGLTTDFKYYYNPKSKAVEVYSASSPTAITGDKKNPENNLLFIAKNPKDLAQYIYMRSDASKNSMLWEDARKMFLGSRSSGNSTPKSSSPKTSTVKGGNVR